LSNLVQLPVSDFERSAGMRFHFRRIDAPPEPAAKRCKTCGSIIIMRACATQKKAEYCTLHGKRKRGEPEGFTDL
jgi:hypothetical protein